jgi:hypothetical protein
LPPEGLLLSRPIPKHPDLLHRHQTVVDHLIEDRQQPLDVLLGVDDFDDDGEIGREIEDVRRNATLS